MSVAPSGGAAAAHPGPSPDAGAAVSKPPRPRPRRTPRTWARSHRWTVGLATGALVWALLVVLVSQVTGRANLLLGAVWPVMAMPFNYLWVRFFREPFLDAPRLEGRTRASLARRRRWVLLAFWLSFFVYMSAFPLYDLLSGTEPNDYVVFGYNLFGSLLMTLVAAFALDVVSLLRWTALKLHAGQCSRAALFAKDLPPKREARWLRVRAAAAFVLYVVLASLALSNGYGGVPVTHLELPLARLPPCLDGYRVGIMSDVHVGPLVGKSMIEDLVAAMNSEAPDALFLIGDMADGIPSKVGDALRPFENIKAPDGVYMVTGNHEYLHGASGDDWKNYWRAQNATVLSNARVDLPPASSAFRASAACSTASLDLVGVNDRSKDHDMPAALEGRDTAREAILLAHQPLHAEEAARYNIGLTVSGHTHAGQTFPFHVLTYLGNNGLFSGLYHLDSSAEQVDLDEATPGQGTTLYVSEGVFGWGPRVRALSSNEQAVITLRNAAAFAAESKTLASANEGIVATERPALAGVALSIVVMPLMLLLCGVLCCAGTVNSAWVGCGCADRFGPLFCCPKLPYDQRPRAVVPGEPAEEVERGLHRQSSCSLGTQGTCMVRVTVQREQAPAAAEAEGGAGLGDSRAEAEADV